MLYFNYFIESLIHVINVIINEHNLINFTKKY